MSRRNVVHATLVGALVLAACSESAAPTGPGPTPAPTVAAVQVSPGSVTVAKGQTRQLEAAVLDAAGRPLTGRAVVWASSDTTVARVAASGVVTAVEHGTATITATADGKSGSAALTVALPVATVTITTPLDTVEAYDTRTLHATLRDEAGRVLTGRAVTWTSSDPAVATVDAATGVLTGVDRGTVTITATSEGKSDTASRVVVIRYSSVSAGTMHACDIASGGIAWCWGLNGRQGRIGSAELSDNAHSTVPVRVPGGQRFMELATYGATTCGLTVAGAAYCWGSNNWGALGTGATTPAQSFSPVAVTGGQTYKQIVAGAGHFCALNMAGRVWCWGTNASGELGNGARASSATPVAAAPELTFAHIAAGAEYTCGVTTAGQSWCWGYSGLGNLGDGGRIAYGNTYSLAPVAVSGGRTFARLAAGQYHTCGLTGDGQLFCWGRNGGSLGTGTTDDSSTPLAVAGGLRFRDIAAGFNHSCAVATDDGVYCWGSNGNGQLGTTHPNGSNSPVRAGGAIAAAEVSAANVATGSASYTCAISRDRLTTWCWGRNDVGQLGNGATTPAPAVNSTPSVVVGQRPL